MRNRRERFINDEPSITVPDLNISVKEISRNGKLDEVSEKQRKRMIFGKRIRMEDLTSIDRFKNLKNRYENILRSNEEAEKRRFEERMLEAEEAESKKHNDEKTKKAETKAEPETQKQT